MYIGGTQLNFGERVKLVATRTDNSLSFLHIGFCCVLLAVKQACMYYTILHIHLLTVVLAVKKVTFN